MTLSNLYPCKKTKYKASSNPDLMRSHRLPEKPNRIAKHDFVLATISISNQPEKRTCNLRLYGRYLVHCLKCFCHFVKSLTLQEQHFWGKPEPTIMWLSSDIE